jgi:hypothetical protein
MKKLLSPWTIHVISLKENMCINIVTKAIELSWQLLKHSAEIRPYFGKSAIGVVLINKNLFQLK